MKLTYWAADRINDSSAYNIRTKTKREALAEKAEQPEEYGPVVKVTVEYDDAFDLLTQSLGECGGRGEPTAIDENTNA